MASRTTATCCSVHVVVWLSTLCGVSAVATAALSFLLAQRGGDAGFDGAVRTLPPLLVPEEADDDVVALLCSPLSFWWGHVPFLRDMYSSIDNLASSFSVKPLAVKKSSAHPCVCVCVRCVFLQPPGDQKIRSKHDTWA